MNKPTALYRAFDETGALLYVGISTDPKRRWKEHAGVKSWWGETVRRIETEWHDSRPEAARAEAKAVREEAPRYNLTAPDERGSFSYKRIPDVRTPTGSTPTKHAPHRLLRIPDEEWKPFGDLVGTRDRTRVVREFIRWYIRQPGAKLPKRPDPS